MSIFILPSTFCTPSGTLSGLDFRPQTDEEVNRLTAELAHAQEETQTLQAAAREAQTRIEGLELAGGERLVELQTRTQDLEN
ncbi:MAG: hypothetical protein KAR79_05920, partial [Simkaniaceae bacterium]|nr:hypothetical protein [Simkaniaceae bacterium]